jgi:hypothetical protein
MTKILKFNNKIIAILFFHILSQSAFAIDCANNSNCRNLHLEKSPEPALQSLNQYLDLVETSFKASLNNSNMQDQLNNKLIAQFPIIIKNKNAMIDYMNNNLKQKGQSPIDFKANENIMVKNTQNQFLEFYNKLTPLEKKSLNQLSGPVPTNTENKIISIDDKSQTRLVSPNKEILQAPDMSATITQNENKEIIEVKNYKFDTIHSVDGSIFDIISNCYLKKYNDLLNN